MIGLNIYDRETLVSNLLKLTTNSPVHWILIPFQHKSSIVVKCNIFRLGLFLFLSIFVRPHLKILQLTTILDLCGNGINIQRTGEFVVNFSRLDTSV